MNTNTDAFNALCIPATNCPTFGINLKKRKALKTLITLKTSKKLKSIMLILNKNVINAGTDSKIRIKSNVFQFDLKYSFTPNSLNLITTSKIKSAVIKLSTIDKISLSCSF